MATVLNPNLTPMGAGLHGSVSGRDLVRLLLRLKWTLWKRSFRKNVGKLIGTIFGVLYGLGGMVGLTVALVAAVVAAGEGTLFPLLIRGLGLLLVTVWLAVPLLAFGLDDTLDPRRFALFPRTARELQPGLFAASALSIPALFTILGVLIASVTEVAWLLVYGNGVVLTIPAVIVMVPANLAGLALCLLLPRAIVAQQAVRATSRRRRELGGVIGIVVLLGVLYGFSLAMQSLEGVDLSWWGRALVTVVEVGAWTPLGALFAVPMDVAQGALLVAALRAVIGTATFLLLWLWWRRSVDAAMRSALVGEASSGSTKVTSLVPRLMRPSAFGAVVGRSLKYWRRDSRYLSGIVIMPVMLVFFVAMGLVSDSQRFTAMLGVVLVAMISGITLSNEIGFDGPSNWVNITASLDPRANLWGRVAAMALFTVPFGVLSAAVVPLLMGYGDLVWLMVPGVIGLMAGSWGASSLIGVLLPYPTSAPGTNPLKDKSGNSANAMIAMLATSAAVFVPQLPTLILAVVGIILDSVALQLAGAGLALVGTVMLLVGTHYAAKILARRHVALFQKVRDHV